MMAQQGKGNYHPPARRELLAPWSTCRLQDRRKKGKRPGLTKNISPKPQRTAASQVTRLLIYPTFSPRKIEKGGEQDKKVGGRYDLRVDRKKEKKTGCASCAIVSVDDTAEEGKKKGHRRWPRPAFSAVAMPEGRKKKRITERALFNSGGGKREGGEGKCFGLHPVAWSANTGFLVAADRRNRERRGRENAGSDRAVREGNGYGRKKMKAQVTEKMLKS